MPNQATLNQPTPAAARSPVSPSRGACAPSSKASPRRSMAGASRPSESWATSCGSRRMSSPTDTTPCCAACCTAARDDTAYAQRADGDAGETTASPAASPPRSVGRWEYTRRGLGRSLRNLAPGPAQAKGGRSGPVRGVPARRAAGARRRPRAPAERKHAGWHSGRRASPTPRWIPSSATAPRSMRRCPLWSGAIPTSSCWRGTNPGCR